jgi:hypothetical protein
MQVTIKLDPKSFEDVRKNFEEYRRVLQKERVPIIQKGMDIILKAWKSKLRSHRQTGRFESQAADKIDGNGKNFTVGHIGNIGAPKEDAIGLNALEYGHALPGQGKDSMLAERNARREGGEKIKRSKKGSRRTDKIQKKIAAVPTIRPAIDETKGIVKKLIGTELKRVIKSLPGGGD